MNLCTLVSQSIQDTKCYTNFSSCSDIFPLVRLILSHFLPVFSQQIQGFGSEIATVALFFVGCVLFACDMKQRQKKRKSKMVQFYLCLMVTVTSKKVAFSRKQGTRIDMYIIHIDQNGSCFRHIGVGSKHTKHEMCSYENIGSYSYWGIVHHRSLGVWPKVKRTPGQRHVAILILLFLLKEVQVRLFFCLFVTFIEISCFFSWNNKGWFVNLRIW